MLYKLYRSCYNRVRTSLIVSPSQKWVWFEKVYLSRDYSSYANIWMADVKGSDVFACKGVLILLFFDQVIKC